MNTLCRFCVILSLLSLLFGSACTSPDPAFASLATTAETNPAPDAIVGMWHRDVSRGSQTTGKLSLLFHQDGTGIKRAVSDTNGRRVTENQQNLSWRYSGGGVWHWSEPRLAGTARLAAGRLLVSGSGFGSVVFERVLEGSF